MASKQKITLDQPQAIPLDRLRLSDANVRRIKPGQSVTELADSIARRGLLHNLNVRPILDMKDAGDVRRMRAIAEETSELVRRYKGSYSGEHGDGISRSEFVEPLFGATLTRAFETVKDAFDPDNRLNPGKIVRAPKFDDRSLFRFKPDYAVSAPMKTALDWSDWGGFGSAVEMCNNNGTCRKLAGGAMCPSYRATGEEQHLTRGRANSLRLAISGQLGKDAFTSPEMKRTLDLCVSCKACRRECPTGVDMAKMKIEFLHHYHARHGLPLRERLIAAMPHRLENLSHNAEIARFDQKYNVVGRLQKMFSDADTAQVIAGSILGFGEFVITSVFETFTVIVMTIYFLGSLPTIRVALMSLVPRSRRPRVALLSDGVLERMGGYVSGAMIVAALAGLAAFLMLTVLQVEFLLPLALLIALTDLIPLVGATIGAVLVTVIVFLESPTKALVVGLFFIAYQQFENFVIYPRVMSRSVDVPPMVAVIAALIGAALLGVVGALLAIPLAAGAIYLFREVVQPRQDAM